MLQITPIFQVSHQLSPLIDPSLPLGLLKNHDTEALSPYKKRLLVFINSKSGMKKSLGNWKKAQKLLRKTSQLPLFYDRKGRL